MDLKINNINFQGKDEIFYGLSKASKIAQNMALCKNANCRIMQSGVFKINNYESSINAYLDMVTKDSEFSKSVILSYGKGLFKPIIENLKQINTEHGLVTPLTEFTSALKKAMKENLTGYMPNKIEASKELLKYFA